MPKTKLKQIQDFLSLKRLALVGLSRDPKDYTRLLFNELKQRGYDVIPVNHNVTEIDGNVCYHSVAQIEPAPEGVLIFTTSTPPENIVKDCIQSGIKNIWIRNGQKATAGLNEIKVFCSLNNINMIEGHCPFMFLPGTQFPHRAHGFFLRLAGGYPVK